MCRLLKSVVASAAEAETCGLFQNAQLVVFIRRCLIALGHPQPPTPIKTDNSTSAAFVNHKMRQRRSKSWDMKLYWLKDKELEKEFRVFWAPGPVNKADPFTKNHPPTHLRQICSQYVVNLLRRASTCRQLLNYLPTRLNTGLRGCADSLAYQPRVPIPKIPRNSDSRNSHLSPIEISSTEFLAH